jgi:hypothetical protein
VTRLTETKTDAVNRLSEQQQHILSWLLAEELAQYGGRSPGTERPGRGTGIRWLVGGSGSQRASYSRSLRRLRRLGLVARCSIQCTDNRSITWSVWLSDEGWAAAERLTVSKSHTVNRGAP